MDIIDNRSKIEIKRLAERVSINYEEFYVELNKKISEIVAARSAMIEINLKAILTNKKAIVITLVKDPIRNEWILYTGSIEDS